MCIVVSEIRLYELVKGKLGTAEAEAFVSLLDSKVATKFEDMKNELATKQDLHALELKMCTLHSETLKTVYLLGVGQFLAILGAIVALMNYMR